jgi:TusA-related sulfurtransferase
MDIIPIDVIKIILNDLLSLEEDISNIIKLKKYFFNLDIRLDLIVNDKNERKLIHEFCEKNGLLSRSEYEKSDEVYTRKCGCGTWSRDYLDIHYAFRCPTEHEDDESDIIGCDETDHPCCNETLEELLEEKEIKLRYKPTGKMLIMRKNNVLFGYKKQTAYRKYKRFNK